MGIILIFSKKRIQKKTIEQTFIIELNNYFIIKIPSRSFNTNQNLNKFSSLYKYIKFKL